MHTPILLCLYCSPHTSRKGFHCQGRERRINIDMAEARPACVEVGSRSDSPETGWQGRVVLLATIGGVRERGAGGSWGLEARVHVIGRLLPIQPLAVALVPPRGRSCFGLQGPGCPAELGGLDPMTL